MQAIADDLSAEDQLANDPGVNAREKWHEKLFLASTCCPDHAGVSVQDFHRSLPADLYAGFGVLLGDRRVTHGTPQRLLCRLCPAFADCPCYMLFTPVL